MSAMEMARSPLSSPRGKRRILVQQDSTGPDPPKKSPVHTSAPVSFGAWDCAWPSNPWNTGGRLGFSPFGGGGMGGGGGGGGGGHSMFGSPTHRCSPAATTTTEVPFSDPPSMSPISSSPSSSPYGGGRRPMLGLIGRGNSKDLMDSYFAMKRNRRRSSCKEITLRILQEDVCPSAANTPQFKTIESRRRVSIAPQLSYEDVLEVQEPTDTGAAAGGDSLDVSGAAAGNFGRSLSADAYDASAKQEARQETQALLFDSVPDLTDAENYDRFPTLRNYRRGAVCYDPDLATDLLTNLSLNDDDGDCDGGDGRDGGESPAPND